MLLAAVLLFAGCRKRTIVCIGDSLTVCGGDEGRYTDYLTKWLSSDIVVNKGVNGDTLAGGRDRFERDVLSLGADVVVIELGANDFWQKKRPIEELKADLEDMVIRAKKAGIEVVIASCFGGRDFEKEPKIEFGRDRFDFGAAIAEMEAEIVAEYGCFYVPNMQIDIKPNGKVPYWRDDNHPSAVGNEFVARRILEQIEKALAK